MIYIFAKHKTKKELSVDQNITYKNNTDKHVTFRCCVVQDLVSSMIFLNIMRNVFKNMAKVLLICFKNPYPLLSCLKNVCVYDEMPSFSLTVEI